MKLILKSNTHTLLKAKSLLTLLSNEDLRNNSISPYYSSVGSHLRHILDFYDCILSVKDCSVDLTARKRNTNIENDCDLAQIYLQEILDKLYQIENDKDKNLVVIDDLGLGRIEINYTLSALLAQANSHTIHHFAIINYILNGLGIQITDENFGFNPTTPKNVNLNQ